ncbi:Alpha/Beta hydrolase protein [Pilobolus umbonatus]|nr:Alpha/Beta hydrolase protein [Pilobolus umbonatus]
MSEITNRKETNERVDNYGMTHNKEEHHVMTQICGRPVFMDTNRSFTASYRISGYNARPGRTKRWPYLGYMINSLKSILLTFYFNWSMTFTAPLSTFALVTIYPTLVCFLVVFEVLLKVFMEGMDGARLMRYLSVKYGEGFGAINWGSSALLLSENTAQLVKSTLPSLGTPGAPISASDARKRTFDISIAQTCVLLSSLIYERNGRNVQKAFKISNTHLAEGEELPAEQETKMKKLLWDSEYRIRAIAESWGLHFAGVSELKSLGGPFCGIFWSETEPFIVVVFKGTTPTNYEEFLVDCTIQRSDANAYLFGSVHQGFYESLFSTTAYGEQDIRDPYGAILAAVHEKAAQLQEKLNTTEPIQLWIAGHSLGAALSSLLFARWLKCPADLTDRLVLRDAYVIGMPAVGDSDFASAFSSYSNLPVTHSSTLWRIINKYDIICRLPPAYDSKSIGNFVSDYDFFNYSHIGHAVQINSKIYSKPLKTYPSSHQSPMKVNVTIGTPLAEIMSQAEPLDSAATACRESPKMPPWAKSWADNKLVQYFMKKNPIPAIEGLYPFFIMDHIPSQYFEGLQAARIYYENQIIARKGAKAVTDSLSVKDPLSQL